MVLGGVDDIGGDDAEQQPDEQATREQQGVRRSGHRGREVADWVRVAPVGSIVASDVRLSLVEAITASIELSRLSSDCRRLVSVVLTSCWLSLAFCAVNCASWVLSSLRRASIAATLVASRLARYAAANALAPVCATPWDPRRCK